MALSWPWLAEFPLIAVHRGPQQFCFASNMCKNNFHTRGKIARQVKTSVNKGELQGRNLIVTFQ
ncbi:MAG: hypothetical protein COS84_10350, partial [Armatimonadetes bacterium CG07_land_8_20_14_0_80_40_9]